MSTSKQKTSLYKSSFGVQSLVLFVIVHSIVSCYLFSHFDFSQGAAVERLSTKGWIFSHLPPSQLTTTEIVLSKFVPDHYVQPIMAARLPRHFPAGLIKESEDDLVLIKSLQVFVLVGGSVSAEDIETIGKLNLVDELHFRYCKFECNDVQIGEALGNLRQLQRLQLIKKGTNAGIVKGLTEIPSLRTIHLGNLAADDIRLLVELPLLERLSLGASLTEIIAATRDMAKVKIARTIRERMEMAGRDYLGSILTLKRHNLPDLVVEY